MTEMKHTPGPWEFGGVANIATTFDSEVNIYPPKAGPGEYQYSGPVAVVAVHDDSGGEANARLIAAAPDLLDALKAFPGFTDDATVGDKWIEQVRAAIAKAEGKP